MSQHWYDDTNTVSLEDAASILSDPDSKKFFPNQYETLRQRILSLVETETTLAQRDDPLPWLTLSKEQTLKLNAWWTGVTNIIDFDANRIGKTAGEILNAIFYMFPIDPIEPVFNAKQYENTIYRLLPRPTIQNILKIQDHFQNHPNLHANPSLPFDHPENAPAFRSIPPELLVPAFPCPPVTPPAYQTTENSLWQGAPDKGFHDDVTIKEWLKWLPKKYVQKISYHDYYITINIPKSPHHEEINWTINFKSYDTPDTKWSGAAVDAILLTECPPKGIFNEIRQRFKETGFGGWDYTPYESRNTSRNSKLAYDIFTKKEEAPLKAHVFTGSGVQDAPDYILPTRKKEDLIRQWQNKPEGQARLHGLFYSNIPLALPNLKEDIHCLPNLTFQQLKQIRPNLRLFRGLDPGWDHVTACVWVAQSSQNELFVYRGYSESGRTISQRVEDIVALSNNTLIKHPKVKSGDYLLEQQILPLSEKYLATIIDHHAFKTDELTGQPFARNYMKAGLMVQPSVTIGPKERALKCDDKLRTSHNFPHPTIPNLPGSKIYFLTKEPGVATIYDKLQNLFWLTYEQGSKKGLSKQTLQDIDDDEFDAFSYVVCSPWAEYYQNKPKSESEEPRELTPTFTK